MVLSKKFIIFRLIITGRPGIWDQVLPVFFYLFFNMVVPGTKCSQKKFGKFFGLKKGDLVPG